MPDSAFTAETSPKAARLLKNLAKSSGPALVYSQFTDVGGLAAIARFLRNDGYSEFVLSASSDPGDPSDPGAASARYAIISGDVPPKDRPRIQEIFNSPENTHGELIRVLLISKTGAEGLDLKGVRQVHIFEPYWDKSRENQVVARGVRLGSHTHLPPEEREVQPFLYIATENRKMFEAMQPSNEEAPSRHRLLEEITINEKFHARALSKYTLILAFQELLREVSLECAINGYGNCRLCVPTDAPLFHEDPVRDLRLPDACQPLTESEVAVQEITLDGVTYFFREDLSATFGVNFFEFDAELEAYSPIDPASGVFMRLYDLYEETAAKKKTASATINRSKKDS